MQIEMRRAIVPGKGFKLA